MRTFPFIGKGATALTHTDLFLYLLPQGLANWSLGVPAEPAAAWAVACMLMSSDQTDPKPHSTAETDQYERQIQEVTALVLRGSMVSRSTPAYPGGLFWEYKHCQVSIKPFIVQQGVTEPQPFWPLWKC